MWSCQAYMQYCLLDGTKFNIVVI